MVAFADLLVRAVPGICVCRTPISSMKIAYIGRRYDPHGDSTKLESEFPILPEGERVKSSQFIRKAIADGELVELGKVG
ncbi:MAG: hypothetical protein WC551_07650 [Patescibacteria group bacterium]